MADKSLKEQVEDHEKRLKRIEDALKLKPRPEVARSTPGPHDDDDDDC